MGLPRKEKTQSPTPTTIGLPVPIAEQSVSIMPPDAALKTNTQVN
jgi:hypothetical protein